MTGKEGLEGACSCFEVCCLLCCIPSFCFGLVKRPFGGLKGTKDLEEGEEVFACSCCKAVEGVTDQVGVSVLINEEANSETFRCGTVVYIWDVWDATTYREPSYDRS